MTPAERQLVTELFDRLTTLEDAPRDADAERLIRDGLRQAPNAVYALVQTALVQDEALRQANARIEELQAQLEPQRQPPPADGFLDNMRTSIFGRREESRGSVPSVRGADAPMGAPAGFGNQPLGGQGGMGAAPAGAPAQGHGGSFLGTAAAAAAGVIGGSLLLDGIRSMSGGSRHGGFGFADPAAAGHGGGSPWGHMGGGRPDDLARSAGIDDIGRSGGAPFGERQGMFNDARGGKSGDAEMVDHDVDSDENFALDDFDDDAGGDFDGGGFGNDE